MKAISLKLLRTLPAIAAGIFALSACGVKISSSEVRFCPKHKVTGDSAKSFLEVMPTGRIIREDSVPEYNEDLELVREMSGNGDALSTNAEHLYIEQLTPRRHGRNRRYKRAIKVEGLFCITDKNVTASAADLVFLTQHPLLLPAVCDMLNAVSPSYQTFVVYGLDTVTGLYFKGIYVNMAAEKQRHILIIDSNATLPAPGYVNDDIPSIPSNNARDKLLVSVPEKGDPVWWQPEPAKATAARADTSKKNPAAAQPAAAQDSLAVDSFRFVCDANYNFTVMLYRDKQGEIGKIGVINNGKKEKPQALYSHLFVAPQNTFSDHGIQVTVKWGKRPELYDTITAVGNLTPGRQDTLFHGPLGGSVKMAVPYVYDTIQMNLQPKGGIKLKDSVLIQLSTNPIHYYPYDRLFNQGSFMRWLKVTFGDLNDLCAGDLAFQVQLRDSNYLKCIFCKPAAGAEAAGMAAAAKADTGKPAANAGKTDSGKVKPGAKVKAGYVQILPSEPVVMLPEYNGKSDTLPTHIRIPLRVFGPYDSTANKIQFALKFGNALSNRLKLIDTVVYLTRWQWDSARAHDGRLNVWLAAQYSRNKDTLIVPQEDFVVIKDSIQLGWRTIQLKNYNPSLPFWLEVGTNFDLLNQIQAHNIYAGIILFDKEAGTIPMFGKDMHFSILAGTAESMTSSTGASGNGVVFRDNRSFVFDSVKKGYPLYTDSGQVNVSSSSKNISLFFAPCLRLTNIPADHNGVHIFVSWYNELLWQTVTTNFDFSQAAPVPGLTRYVPLYTLRSYFYKVSSTTTDFRAVYTGLGMPLYIKRTSFEFFVNPVVGVTNQHFVAIRANTTPSDLQKYFKTLDSSQLYSNLPVTFAAPNNNWNLFYLLQFRFNEQKYDVSVTGEIRTDLIRHTAPLVTLTLSKKFDLGKILSGILAPIATP